MSQNKQSVCVLGLGYMGLPTASLLANNGFEVTGVDVNQEKVDSINRKEILFDEPGLKELVLKAIDSGNFKAQTKVSEADIFVIAVPTPFTEDKKADLTFVEAATKMIASVLKKGDLVILESTVSPGTCTKLMIPILEENGLKAAEDFLLSHCPERAIPGNTMYELVYNDRIIGGIDDASCQTTKEIYESFVRGQIYLTDTTTAETVKLMENTFRDVNIALANEFAQIAEEIGIDIWETIELANKHPRVNILKPGPGVGGHCIAIDPWFLTEASTKAVLIKAARNINDAMPSHVIELAKDVLKDINQPKVTILGMAYKANVDDARETPATEIINEAKKLGWQVAMTDPYVKTSEFPDLQDIDTAITDSDCVILVTNHDQFLEIDPSTVKGKMKTLNLIDTRNFLDQAKWKNAGFTVKILGNGKV
jgi:UDP-N-acetyl-D-mannosaminuronic acid dehydrogenase